MDLDSIKAMKKLDTGFVAESIAALPDQIKQVLNEIDAIRIPENYGQINKIVLNGMGGSNLGARMIKSLFAGELKFPLIIEPGYVLPEFIDKKTLYILCSYSGTTEEPLSTLSAAMKNGAKIIAITAKEGKDKKNILLDLIKKHNLTHYVFDPKYNPSLEPRMGLGYLVAGTLVLFNKIGALKINLEEIRAIARELKKNNVKFEPASALADNKAKQIAKKMLNTIPVLVAGDQFEGNLHILRNQINESAKNFCAYLTVPELNHHAMEGLRFPRGNKKDLLFLFFDSKLYHPRISKRLELTKRIVKKNGIRFLEIGLTGKTKLAQAFEIYQSGLWISYYLGLLNGVDPRYVKWVNWFKKELGGD
ncbi:MAG: SIS domain-containing protein [Patescibacteria group bacterium]|jgi:glucose/mannose-6-phosphate isomerase